jgi:hypothetical protein
LEASLVPNYTSLAATAKRLVQAAGRTVALQIVNTTSDDVAKPWDGPADPTATPSASITGCSAAFVPITGAASLGIKTEYVDLLRNCSQVAILTLPDSPGAMDPLEATHLLDSDSSHWRVLFIQELRPAEVALCYYVGVAR